MSLKNFVTMFRGKIKLQNVIYIGVQIIKRLMILHQYGYVYNNLNGANIFIGRDDIEELPRGNLLDNLNAPIDI